MKLVFRVVALVCAGMIVVFFAVGALLADGWQVRNEVTVTASPEQVRQLVADLDGWKEWSQINVVLGPNTERSVEGEPGVVGHRIVWRGSQGESALALTSADPSGIGYEYRLQLAKQDTARTMSRGEIRLAADGTGTRVTWTETGRVDTFAEGFWLRTMVKWSWWFGALQDTLARQQQTSLNRLQQKLEGKAAPAGPK